jgi:hypothetical protein
MEGRLKLVGHLDCESVQLIGAIEDKRENAVGVDVPVEGCVGHEGLRR